MRAVSKARLDRYLRRSDGFGPNAEIVVPAQDLAWIIKRLFSLRKNVNTKTQKIKRQARMLRHYEAKASACCGAWVAKEERP